MIIDGSFDNIFEILAKHPVVVVDFYTNWCQPCQRMLRILPRLEEKIPDIPIVKINADENKLLTELYGFTKIPTFIFFKNGVEAYRNVGTVMTLAKIEEKVAELVAK